MVVASFFTGGFSTINLASRYLGLEFEFAIACEYDKFARKSYLKNYGSPTMEMSEDIFTFNGLKYKNKIDLAHFSPECVDFSPAGRRKGEKGRSGGQYAKTIEIIEDMKPKIVIIENVANFAHQFSDVMERVLTELREVGYQVSWHIMSADDYGTPQTRKRVFIVGFLGSGSKLATPTKKKLEVCIGDLLEDSVDDKYYLSDKALQGFKRKIEKQGKQGFKFNPRSRNDTIGTLTAGYGKQGITYPFVIDPKPTLEIVANVNDSQSGRVYALDGLAPTMSANGGGLGAKNGLFDTKYGIRRLTPREAARAMGDTLDYFELNGFSDTRLYRFIGNAIDINTYKALLVDVLAHKEVIDFDSKRKFAKTPTTQTSLFDFIDRKEK